MTRLLRFLLGLFVFFLAWNWFFPAPHDPPANPASTGQTEARISLRDVSEKSRDALTTTAAYMRQEKNRLEAAMGVTLQKLDRLIVQMQERETELPETERAEWHHRINDWEAARHNVSELKNRIRPAESSTVDHLKANWQAMEVDITHRMLTHQQP